MNTPWVLYLILKNCIFLSFTSLPGLNLKLGSSMQLPYVSILCTFILFLEGTKWRCHKMLMVFTNTSVEFYWCKLRGVKENLPPLHICAFQSISNDRNCLIFYKQITFVLHKKPSANKQDDLFSWIMVLFWRNE